MPTDRKAYKKKYNAENKEKRRVARAEYRAKNVEKLNAKSRAHYWANREVRTSQHKTYRFTIDGRWAYFVAKAKMRNLEVTITKRDFQNITSTPCLFCNSMSPGRDHVGVDRYDNTKGYTRENSAPCCKICN